MQERAFSGLGRGDTGHVSISIGPSTFVSQATLLWRPSAQAPLVLNWTPATV